MRLNYKTFLLIFLIPVVFASFGGDDSQSACETGGDDWFSSAHYPGTYSFTDEDLKIYNETQDEECLNDLSFADEVDIFEGVEVQIISGNDGHDKVLYIKDRSTIGYATITDNFTATESGTIEFWIKTSDGSIYNGLNIGQRDVGLATFLSIHSNKLMAYYDSSWHDISSITNNVWYHIRIDFEAGSGGYQGLSPDYFKIYVNGGTGQVHKFRYPRSEISYFTINSRNSIQHDYYLDAVGYSWDADYTIGDNAVAKCCGDDGASEIFYQGYLSNTSHFCHYGFNNNEFIDFNQTLCEYYGYDWVSGNIDYPATYSFTDDSVGVNPADWGVEESGGSIGVISDYINHNKVVKLHDSSGSCDYGGRLYFYNNISPSQSSGIVEYWLTNEDMTLSYGPFSYGGNFGISLREGGTEIIKTRIDDSNNFEWYCGGSFGGEVPIGFADWHHIKVSFDCATDTYDLWVNNTLLADDCAFQTSASSIDQFHISTPGCEQNMISYIDALTYSWDNNYEIGDNFVPACCGDDGVNDNFNNNNNNTFMCINGGLTVEGDFSESACFEENPFNTWFTGTLTGNNGPCCGDDGVNDNFYNNTKYCFQGAGTEDGDVDENVCYWENSSNIWFTGSINGNNSPCCGDDESLDYFGNTTHCCSYGVYTSGSCPFSPAGCLSEHIDLNGDHEWSNYPTDDCGLANCTDFAAIDEDVDYVWDGYCYSGALNDSCISSNLPPFNTSFTVTVTGNLTQIGSGVPVTGETITINANGVDYTDVTDSYGGWSVEVTYWELNCATSNQLTAYFTKDDREYTVSETFTAVK